MGATATGTFSPKPHGADVARQERRKQRVHSKACLATHGMHLLQALLALGLRFNVFKMSCRQLRQPMGLTRTHLRPTSYKKFWASAIRRVRTMYCLQHTTPPFRILKQMQAKDVAEDVVVVGPEVVHAGRLFWRLPWHGSGRRKRPLRAALCKHGWAPWEAARRQ